MNQAGLPEVGRLLSGGDASVQPDSVFHADARQWCSSVFFRVCCRTHLLQEGHCKPGEVLFGTDSHTCNAGAFGQFATGVGNTDAGFILGTGKLLIKVGMWR